MGAVLLEGEKRGVEAGEPVGVGHVHIVAGSPIARNAAIARTDFRPNPLRAPFGHAEPRAHEVLAGGGAPSTARALPGEVLARAASDVTPAGRHDRCQRRSMPRSVTLRVALCLTASARGPLVHRRLPGRPSVGRQARNECEYGPASRVRRGLVPARTAARRVAADPPPRALGDDRPRPHLSLRGRFVLRDRAPAARSAPARVCG